MNIGVPMNGTVHGNAAEALMGDQVQQRQRRLPFYFVFDAHIAVLTRTKVNDWVDALLRELRKMPVAALVSVEMLVFGTEGREILPLTPLADVKPDIFRFASVSFERNFRSSAAAIRAVTKSIQENTSPTRDYAPIVLMVMGDSPDDIDKASEPAQSLTALRYNGHGIEFRALVMYTDTRMPPVFKSIHSLHSLSQPHEMRNFLREMMSEVGVELDAVAAAPADTSAPSIPAPKPTTKTPTAAAKPAQKKPAERTVFISYQRGDWDEFVRPLVDRLRADGLSIWIDQHLIEGGADWMDTINDALDTCDCMILCVSPEALASRYVKYEYRYFFNNDKRIYPVICRQAKLPPELATLQYYLYDFIDLEKLTALLKAR